MSFVCMATFRGAPLKRANGAGYLWSHSHLKIVPPAQIVSRGFQRPRAQKDQASMASSKLQETKPSPWCWRAVATTQTKPRSRRPQRLRRRLRRCRPGNGPPFFKGWFFGGYRLQLGYHWERPHVFGFCQISEDWAECLSAVSCESGSGRNHPAQWNSAWATPSSVEVLCWRTS